MNDTPEEPADLSGLEAKDSSSKAQSAEAEQASKAILQALTDLKAENADLRDRNLRIIAEMENFRRRAERDKSESVKYAASEFGRDMISVADNLRRAIEAVSKDASEQSPAVKTLLEGVEATERELFKTFERHGITRFDPLGEKFDPHNHEAVVKVDVPNVPADVIVQVLQAGYKIADRVLRPATVILAKGGAPTRSDRGGPSEGMSRHGAGSEGASPGGQARSHHHHDLEVAHEHDPDLIRDAAGTPKGVHGVRRDRPGEKRTSSVTQPVTDSAPTERDDMMSSLGRRLENNG
jgi:molecular chaperone GrpE